MPRTALFVSFNVFLIKIQTIKILNTTFPRPFSVLAIALFVYYTSVPAGAEVK